MLKRTKLGEVKNESNLRHHSLLEVIAALPSKFQRELKLQFEESKDPSDLHQFYINIGQKIEEVIHSGALDRRNFLQLTGLLTSSGLLSLLFPKSLHANGTIPFGFWGAGARKTSTIDSFVAYRSLLLNGEGSIGALNAFLDSSSNSFSTTKSGTPYQGTFTPFSVAAGKWSAYFNGSGDFLTPATTTTMNTANFTVECWLYIHSVTATDNSIYECRSTSGSTDGFTLELTGTTTSYLNVFSTSRILLSSVAAPKNQWIHVALVRNGNVWTLYQDGTNVASGTYAYNLTSTTNYIGKGNWTGSEYNGHISNLRLVKGTALYTSNFSIPTSPLTAISGTTLLTCQDHRFKDNSTNNAAIVASGNTKASPMGPFPNDQVETGWWTAAQGGSACFDGNSDWITVPSQTNLALGTGDFTLECWIYALSAGDDPIWESRSTNGNTDGFTLTAFDAGNIRIYTSGVLIATSGLSYLNQWTHVAVVRYSGTTSLYINGISSGTTTALGNLTNTDAIICGARYSRTTASLNGYLSSLRLVKGTAVYTTNFTPPTSPLTAISNTQLLFNFTNSDIIDSSGKNNVYSVGNLAQGSYSPFSAEPGYWGIYDDGVSSYLETPSITLSGDWTVEGWFFLNSYLSNTSIHIISPYNAGGGIPLLIGGWQNYFDFYLNSHQTSTVPLPLGKWFHAALVMSSGTATLYYNGTSIKSQTGLSGASYSYPWQIGSYFQRQSGYYSNVRFSNIARYTSNFIVSTLNKNFTSDANTILLTCQDRRFIDNSPSPKTLTPYGKIRTIPLSPFPLTTTTYSPALHGGSTYFPAVTGSYLYLPENPGLNIGTGNFTIETWVNTSDTTYGPILNTYSNQGATGFMIILTNFPTSTGVGFELGNTWLLDSGAKFCNGTWRHLAIVRNGTALTMYVDGIAVSTATSSATIGSGTGMYIGYQSESIYSSRYFNGYLSDFRIIKGVARYTSNFTPPSAPLKIVTNTSLLLNFTNASIIDSTRKNNFTRSNNAQISTVTKKFGSGSIQLSNMNVDSLSFVDNGGKFLFPGDFTIAGWHKHVSGSDDSLFVLSNGSTYFAINYDSTFFNIYLNSGSPTFSISAASTNFQHFALVRYGSSIRLYIDGVDSGGVTNSTTLGYVNPSLAKVGNGPFNVQEFIDEFTITNGVALYTSNFNPSGITGY